MQKFDAALESYASETALCIAFVKNIEQRKSLGLTYPFLYHHIVNEQPRQKNGSEKAAAIIGHRLNMMGRRAGVSDYQFVWSDLRGLQMGVLEAKMPNGRLTKTQQDYFDDCKEFGIHTGVFHTVQEGLRFLQEWGIIKPDVWA